MSQVSLTVASMDQSFQVTIRTRSGAEHIVSDVDKEQLDELRTLTHPEVPQSSPQRSTIFLTQGKTIDVMLDAIESVSWVQGTVR